MAETIYLLSNILKFEQFDNLKIWCNSERTLL